MPTSKHQEKLVPSLENLLDIDSLMTVLKVKSKQTVYKLIGSGLPSVYIGGHLRFIPSEIAKWVHEQRG